MDENLKFVIEGEDGQTYSLNERARLEIWDPKSNTLRNILVLEDENGDSLFFDIVDQETIEQVQDPDLIESLMNIDIASL